MNRRRHIACWFTAGCLAAAVTLPAIAGTPQPPDWVLAAAHASTPNYPADTIAVALDDEETLTVQPDGKATLLKRRVIKILRPQGRDFAYVFVPIDRDRKLRSLHVWSIAADGHPYTLRDNEIAEVGDDEYGMLYVDLHAKAAHAPAVDPGAVVAYEYERTMRPYVQEYTWDFQDSIPTLRSVFELILPRGLALLRCRTQGRRRGCQPARAGALPLADGPRSGHRHSGCADDAGVSGDGRPACRPLLA